MNKIYKAFPEGKHKVLTLSYDDGKLADRRSLIRMALKVHLILILVLMTQKFVFQRKNGKLFMQGMKLPYILLLTLLLEDVPT